MRQILVDSPDSVGARSRRRRWLRLQTLFPAIREMSVLDLGGTVAFWEQAPVRPRRLTVINLLEPGESDSPQVVPVLGDACTARETLEKAGVAQDFDLVLSNSLLEHVGGHAKRAELAREIAALAPRHWVQTPYRYFPIEPHWLFPMMQFMPVRLRRSVSRGWPLAHSRPQSAELALEEVLWTELLSVTEMRAYFPESTIERERFLGMTKSLIAVRTE